MRGPMAIALGTGLALVLSTVLSPLTSTVAAQGQQPGASRNVLNAQAAPGLVRLESPRFTWLPCLARVATAIESLPGIHEVGQLPETFPPVVFVRFEAGQTSAEAIVEAAKRALETDPEPSGATPVAVSIEAAELEAPAALEPVRRFPAADLWVTPIEAAVVRLNSESFSCGTCLKQATYALEQGAGVLEVRAEGSPRPNVLIVTYDPSVIGPEEIGQIAAKGIEADELLQQTVTVYHLTPN